MTIQALKRRFDELLVQADEVERTKRFERQPGTGGDYFVDNDSLLGWQVKVRNLLSRACGAESEHYKQFERTEKTFYATNHQLMLRQKAVLLAAKEDYEGGYLSSIRSLVHAELFDDELEQARELYKQAKELQLSGYMAAAAVVAGVVLETTLRKLCGDRAGPFSSPICDGRFGIPAGGNV